MFRGLTKRAQKILTILSQEEAKHFHSTELLPEHVMLAIIRSEEGSGYRLLETSKMDILELKLELEKACISKKSGFLLGDAPLSRRLKIMLETAAEEAHYLESEYIGTEHLVLANAREESSIFQIFLQTNKISFEQLRLSLREIASSLEEQQVRNVIQNSKYGSQTPNKNLLINEYSVDLTELALNNKMDPVIDRERELRRVIQILCRRTKNNPVLIGEPGVGKTAIVEGLAQWIAQKNVPALLQDKRVVMLDIAAIVAGTKYRGEFEDRLKKIIKEIAAEKNIILFIDELHTLIGAGGAEGTIDASNMLKPSLSRGEIQCIGTTTTGEYRKYLEKDPALERRFQAVVVEEPDQTATIKILKGLQSYYENFHNVTYSEEALETAVLLAKRFLHEKAFPDKAIDILDEAGASKQFLVHKSVKIENLRKQIAELNEQKLQLVSRQRYEAAASIRDSVQQLRKELDSELASPPSVALEVSDNDIYAAVSVMTGIPLEKIRDDESVYLQNMEQIIHRTVVGQNEAVTALSNAMRRARAGISDDRRPYGSFIFLGPTGVGKTLLAKTLAETLFGDMDALIRIDMSDFMEKHTVARLVGSPPGYVGYEEGGLLTEKIRHKPYCVVLFDEIEKAHPDVFNLLLQILEEGELRDNLGHVVSFRNTVLIMTSNAGTRETIHGNRLGFGSEEQRYDYDVIKNSAIKELNNFLRPEFVNRVDDIIVFEPLKKENMHKILEIELDKLQERLLKAGIVVEVGKDARDYCVEHGYDPAYGARPLRRLIVNEIENRLASSIISGEYKSGSSVAISCKNDSLVFSVVSVLERKKELTGAQSVKH